MHFLICQQKEKEKHWTGLGSFQPELAHDQVKRAPAPVLAILRRDPQLFEKPVKNSRHRFSVSLTFAQKPLSFYFFSNSNPGDGALTRRPSSRWNTPQMATPIETEHRIAIPDPRRT
jgi:hypothetical protein